MKNQIFSRLLFTGALALSSLPAAAGIVTYSSTLGPYSSDALALAAWQGAGSQDGVITFEGITIPPNSISYTLAPITLSSNPGNFLQISTNTYSPGSGNYEVNPSPLNLTSSTNVFGLAFNFRCYGCDGQVATITITDSAGITVFSVPTTSTGIANYFGVRDSLNIQNLQISFGGAFPYVAIDNIAYSTAGANANTPEVATFLMIATGLGFLARMRRGSFLLPRIVL